MFVVLAWFSARAVSETERQAARARFDAAVADLVPGAFVRHDSGGDDWGVSVLALGDQGAYRWPVITSTGPVTAVSLGLPVGVDAAGGPVALAQRLLDGEDIHRAVVPPFGLLALDAGGRFAAQQDWLGMCRLFTRTADGITVLSSRPSLVGTFLDGTVEPDLDGWGSYAVGGYFAGDSSPVRDVRLLRAGERITGRRRSGGGWEVANDLRFAVDDVVLAGYAGQGRPLDESLDLAATAITGATGSISGLYADEISLGLSGGKDSRLIAAALIAGGQRPRFTTNEDTAAEGETARRLVQILRDKRGLALEHQLVKSGAADSVLSFGLRERIVRLQRTYDFQFPASYAARPALRTQLRDFATPASFTGAAGELSTGAWYPAEGAQTAEEVAHARLTSAVGKGVATDEVIAAAHERVAARLEHAKSLGLTDMHLIDYVFLTDRLRRQATSAYAVGMVTPFLAPGFVSATFGLTPAQKREKLLHNSLIARLVPEWSEVPFVSISTGVSTATRIWDGDGVRVIADLLDTAQGPIGGLLRRDQVEKALLSAVRKDKADQRTLRQFAYLAVASEHLEPAAVAPATSATFARVTAPPKPKVPAQRQPSGLGRLKQTRLWKGLRRRLR
jgi:asparagine synthase (glutamine-hydrolysing)